MHLWILLQSALKKCQELSPEQGILFATRLCGWVGLMNLLLCVSYFVPCFPLPTVLIGVVGIQNIEISKT